MKIKLTRPDGTVIEAEGTVEECQEFALALSPAPAPRAVTVKSAPVQLPLPMQQPFVPWGPSPWDVYPYTPVNPPIMPWQTVPYTPEITWWMPSSITTDRITLTPTSEFLIGGQMPLTSGSIVMDSGWQCTPTGANMC